MATRKKLQVFVSSTFEDLVGERQAAVSSILKTGHIPAGMELFTAGDQSQMTTIQRWIDESDVYMLILGGRYGSVEETSGISYTELEYDYAAMQEKPLFAVVIKEDALELKVKAAGSACMETKNPAKLAAFRKKVLSNMSSFYADDKDIKLCVYESLAELSATRKMKGWVSGDEVGESKYLQSELNAVREENRTLKERLAKAQVQQVAAPAPSKLEDVKETISKLDVEIPEILSKDGTKKSNTLYNLFYLFREKFATGVQNRAGMSDLDRFLYFNVGPKLHIHGLVDSEKVVGVSYRRMFSTKFGLELLASIDREVARGNIYFSAEKKDEKDVPAPVNIASPDSSTSNRTSRAENVGSAISKIESE